MFITARIKLEFLISEKIDFFSSLLCFPDHKIYIHICIILLKFSPIPFWTFLYMPKENSIGTLILSCRLMNPGPNLSNVVCGDIFILLKYIIIRTIYDMCIYMLY